MPKLDNVYEPHEDSYLLLRNSLEYLKNKHCKKVCEIGVGSGFVISNIARKYDKHKYFGSDINPDAINITKERFQKLNQKNKNSFGHALTSKTINQKVVLKQTNLLEEFNEKFDLILFNTPYLPCERGEKYEDLTIKDKAIYGGKKGYEIIEQFIYQINDKLEDNGCAIMIYSSFSNHKKITQILENNLFKYEIVEQKRIFFEDLYSLKISKSKLLKQLTCENLTNMKYLSSGKHSIVLKAKCKGKDVVVKLGEEKDIQIEEIFLKKFQEYGFVPKLILAKKNYVVMEYLEGLQIKDYFNIKRAKNEIVEVFNNILNITQTLDNLGINKFELTKPSKHIFIEKSNSVKFIDFERCLHTQKPKNTTQILQYIKRLKPQFKENNIYIDEDKIFEISTKYKKEKFEIRFENLMK